VNSNLPTRSLPKHPDLNQLKRQAKELLEAFAAGDPKAIREVNELYRGADHANFALHDAQLVLARAYGFESWPKLKAHVDGVTVKRLVEAVRDGDGAQARALLKVRPELAHMSADNLQVLHHAILNRASEMVRMLMELGANAREGVYPHRDATSALTIARERGYDEIVAIIKEEEQRRREAQSGITGAPSPDELFRAIASADDERSITLMESHPALIHTCHGLPGWTPLHVACKVLNTRTVIWLLDHGAQAGARGWHDLTPLDVAAHFSGNDLSEEFAAVTARLLMSGAALTPAAAAALGDAGWLRARHAEGVLVNRIEDTGGLLRIAASHNRPEILRLLLDFGFDPNERKRFGEDCGDEVVFTWGMPLWHCASSGKYEIAELLLSRGADPNAAVYASGTPLYQAYGRRDWKMVELLQRYGGRPNGTVAGLYRQTELAKRLLAGEAGTPAPDGMFAGKPLAEELLWAGACGGDPDIVRMALERVDWPRDDARWFHILEQPLRIWNHGSGHWANPDWDRGTYQECFRQVLHHCDANVRGRMHFGLTILHSVAGSREHVTAEERLAFATILLDAGARLDIRDNLLQSTPLGWACRWGRMELVRLLLQRGADPVEPDADPWATPQAWAQKMGHDDVVMLLREYGG
jgi:ankyrin repeat protein